ncbi:hypothetical protein BDV18DRAFT_157375 [Aspergillus unguis]
MTDRPFFENWPGTIINLPAQPSTPPSSWELMSILSDKNNQLTAAEFNEPGPRQGNAGGAFGIFRCRNIHEPSDVAVMEVFIQVPYAGSEYAIYEERARQASKTGINMTARRELDSLEALTKAKCPNTPLIRQKWETKQDSSGSSDKLGRGLVPGGFLCYVLMEHAKGVQMEKSQFWSRDAQEREMIRRAFKEAYLNCLEAGVLPWMMGQGHLFWDAGASKM